MKEPIDLEPLFPDRSSDEPLGAQLVRRLRTAIKSGFFAPGSRLLPSRELARRLGLSRNTVTSVFDQLIAEGYLEARVGVGTFVTEVVQAARARAAISYRPAPRSQELQTIGERLDAVGNSFGALRIGAPDYSLFPIRSWQRLVRRSAAAFVENLDYGEPHGILPLREAIARHIAQFRGVVADPDQVIVVEGAQAAFHLTGFALTHPGQSVAIEDPCYQHARAIFSAHRLTLRGVVVDRHGMRTAALPQAALAYVTPSHQFPLGGAMPLGRRNELLEWAHQTGAYVIEDDYDSEFDAHPLPALQSLDRFERVIYVGTLSKTLAPGLRTGYVVVPRHLANAFRILRSVASLGMPVQLQSTIASFISQGYFSRHVRRMTAVYERRRRILVDALAATLPDRFHIGPAQTGLHVAIVGPADFDDVAAANSARRVLPLSLLCIDRTDCKGLLVGFSAGDDDAVARAATALGNALAGGRGRRLGG